MNTKQHEIKKIGAWMDHAEAKFIEPDNDSTSITIIHCADSGIKRVAGESADGTKLGNYRSSNNEFHKERKEENATREYFKSLAEYLLAYDEIFLFGPTTANKEFKNYLSEENKLASAFIQFKKTDYLTDPQIAKTVKEFFSAKKEFT